MHQIPLFFTSRSVTTFFHAVRNTATLLTTSARIQAQLCHEFGAHFCQFKFYVHENEDTAMARFQNSTFSTLRLSKEDEKKFTSWVTSEKPTTERLISTLLADGFKVSISWVTDSNAFCFSLIGTDNTKQNRGMVMTSWSDEFDEVVQIAAYKHYMVCGGGEWPSEGEGQRWG